MHSFMWSFGTQRWSITCLLHPQDVTPICFHQPEDTELRERRGGGLCQRGLRWHTSVPVLFHWQQQGHIASEVAEKTIQLCAPKWDNGFWWTIKVLCHSEDSFRTIGLFKSLLSFHHMPSTVLRAGWRSDWAASWAGEAPDLKKELAHGTKCPAP